MKEGQQRKLLQVKVLEFQKKAFEINDILSKPKEEVSVFQKIQLASIVEDVEFINQRIKEKSIQLSELQEYFSSSVVPAGEYFFRANETGDCFFILLKGLAHAISEESGQSKRIIAQFLPGETFGQLSVMYSMPRSTSVVAAENCIAICVNKQFYERFLWHQQEVQFLLKIIQGCPRFSGLSEYDLKILSSRSRLVRFREQILVEQGKALDMCFIVIKGRLKIRHRSPRPELAHIPFLIGHLLQGDFFGDYVLGLAGGLSDVEIEGEERGELACIKVNEIANFQSLRVEFLKAQTIVPSCEQLLQSEIQKLSLQYNKARMMHKLKPQCKERRLKFWQTKRKLEQLQAIGAKVRVAREREEPRMSELIRIDIEEAFRKSGLDDESLLPWNPDLEANFPLKLRLNYK